MDEITTENLWNQEALAQPSLVQMPGGLAELRTVVKCPFPKKKTKCHHQILEGVGSMDSLP